jgi:hypothetical protein
MGVDSGGSGLELLMSGWRQKWTSGFVPLRFAGTHPYAEIWPCVGEASSTSSERIEVISAGSWEA